jgi:hypothetical protein
MKKEESRRDEGDGSQGERSSGGELKKYLADKWVPNVIEK